MPINQIIKVNGNGEGLVIEQRNDNGTVTVLEALEVHQTLVTSPERSAPMQSEKKDSHA